MRVTFFYFRSSLRQVLIVDTIQDIIHFGHNNGDIEHMELDYTSVRGYGHCPTCDHNRYLLLNFISDSTWLLYFERFNHSIDWSVSDLPLNLIVNDASNPGQTVIFDLGYVSLSKHTREMSHSSSLQYLGSQWYYYDGLKFNGKLANLKWPPNWRKHGRYLEHVIKRKRLNIEGVFYFRR